jgi:CheY-like chemotaxis protein
MLIVDDERLMRSLLRDYLKGLKWTVHEAENGEEALAIVRSTPLDFIISDVYMPVMNGLNFYKAVIAEPATANIPFLFISGFDDDLTRQAVQQSANAGFLKKGRPMSELKTWIEFLQKPKEKRKGRTPFDTTVWT